MKLCCAGWGFRALDYDIYFAAAEKLGFKRVELQVSSDDRSSQHIGLSPTDADIEGVLHAARDAGVQIAVLGGTNDFLGCDDLMEEIKMVCRQVDVTAALGATVLRVFAGWKSFHDVIDRSYVQAGEALNSVGEYAAKHGVFISVENHGGITGTAAQMLRLLDSVSAPNVGANYDPANFANAFEDPYAAYRVLRDRINYVHLKDIRWENGAMHYCAIGDGLIEWDPIVRGLLNSYAGYWGIEYEDTTDVMEGTRRCLEALREYTQETQHE